jgi:hypothetical protein
MQGLISVNQPGYQQADWHATLLAIGTTVLDCLVNIYAASFMPPLQNFFLILHFLAFGTVVAILWTMAPRASAHSVFLEFNNGGAWPNVGVSLLVGQISALWTISGK